MSLWSFWVSFPGCVPTQDLAHTQHTYSRERNVGETALINDCCVVNVSLATNAKHSTMRGAMGKLNSISAGPNAVTKKGTTLVFWSVTS